MGRRLKGVRHRRLLVLTGLLVVALTATTISPALGGPGFLTKREAKKIFFTKKKTNRLFLRKAAAASTYYTKSQADTAFLSPAEGDGRYLPANGTTRLQITPDNWIAAGSGTTDHFSGQVQLAASGASTLFFNAALNLPSSLQGQTVSLDSFELCYSATNASATLDRVFLFRIAGATAADPFPSGTTPIDDDTNRDDSTCRTYAGASPITIGPNDFAQVVVRNLYTGAGQVTVGRLTLNLST